MTLRHEDDISVSTVVINGFDEFFCNYICDFVITKRKCNKIKREHGFSKNDCEHALFCFYGNFSGFI